MFRKMSVASITAGFQKTIDELDSYTELVTTEILEAEEKLRDSKSELSKSLQIAAALKEVFD